MESILIMEDPILHSYESSHLYGCTFRFNLAVLRFPTLDEHFR